MGTKELWFVTGSQHLYGPEAIEQVAQNSADIVAGLDGADAIPVKVVAKPVLTTPEEIRRVLLEANSSDECIGVIAWMHTFSPSKMWIAGLGALQKPLLHLHTQHNRDLPWADIDMDFMNLNQAAHGDREFGYMLTRLRHRRKTVVGHWGDPQVQERVGNWARAALGWNEVQNLKLVRFGDNMRYVGVTEGDKTEAQIRLGVEVNTYGVNELAERVATIEDKAVDELAAVYEADYDVVPELRAGGARHESLRDAARIELGLRSVLEEHGAKAFTDTFEDLGTLKQLPGIAVQRLMADGYGFGGEGDWKTAVLVRLMKVMATACPAAPPSWRTTRTTWARSPRRSSARTCSKCAPRSPLRSRPRRSTRSASAARRTRSAWSSPPRPARPSWSACSTSALGCAWSPTRSTRSSPTRTSRTCRSRAPCGCPAPTSRPPRRPG
nr:hypothetical protein GCM10025732_23200 [Glycomyces mayteni]